MWDNNKNRDKGEKYQSIKQSEVGCEHVLMWTFRPLLLAIKLS